MADDDIPLIIISRQDAKLRGLKRFFTGIACPHNHVTQRYTSTGGCVGCMAANAARWYAKNPVKAAGKRRRHRLAFGDKVRKWEKATKERRKAQDPVAFNAAARVRGKRHYDKYPERQQMQNYASYWSNLEVPRARSIKWARDNPEKARANDHRRRARKAKANGSYTDADITALLEQQRGLCAGPECGKDISSKYTVDHIQPLDGGGSNWPDNLQLLCFSCNASKGTKTMDEWLAFRILIAGMMINETDKKIRNQKIYEMHLSGLSFATVAIYAGLTKARIRQICAAFSPAET